MSKKVRPEAPYKKLLSSERRRTSRVRGRSLEEEADSDRGRVLFSAPFRRLQNKAQVFSLETNASVRSRLTHSLEVSSIGRYVAQQAVKSFNDDDLSLLGLKGNERALTTFVETACLLHDIGNPPFGHFGEVAISEWFETHEKLHLQRPEDGDGLRSIWEREFKDLRNFDGNPQGFRLIAKLQASETDDLHGLNLTATTLAATIKYPWSSDSLGKLYPWSDTKKRKKCGYFRSEEDVCDWIRKSTGMPSEARHPLAYLMEAADDIAYCVSDIEDALEKGLADPKSLSEFLAAGLADAKLEAVPLTESQREDLDRIHKEVKNLSRRVGPLFSESKIRLTPMQDLRSALIRLLASRAGSNFAKHQQRILSGKMGPLLESDETSVLLKVFKDFAESRIYNSSIVRNRELTAHAAIFGILDAYKGLMVSSGDRWSSILKGQARDGNHKLISRDSSLYERLALKYRSVYIASLKEARKNSSGEELALLDRLLRLRLVTDHVSAMTDEFALQTHHLIGGLHINPYRT